MSKVKIIDRRSEISIMSERNLLSKLNHPFIVNIYFAFQDFCNLYLVMDLLTGGDLRYHIAHQKTFSEVQTKFFISNMLLALEYIHSQNIIHRDIKPENLVLESTGYLRITDFGVAKINEIDNSSETSGTPGYMAPEVILVQNHSFPSDFFALGVIGYEFMLGYRPYLGRGRKEIKHLIISKQAKLNINDVPDDWSEESRDFINLLLQRKPKKRLGFNGVKEIKDHPWMRDIDWELLMKKKVEAPYIPPSHKENFDKKYCEGEDNIGEETMERYELYLQSELYEDVFKNYTFVNMNYVKKYYKKRKQQKLSLLYNAHNNKNTAKNTFYTIDKENHIDYNENLDNDIKKKAVQQKNTIDYDTNLKLDKNKNNEENINNNPMYNRPKIIDENNIIKLTNNKNEKINIENNSIKRIAKSTKNLFSKNYGKSSASTTNLNYKYNSPLVKENIICNNYINFNFNNYQSNNIIKNKKNSQENNEIIDKMSSLKHLLNSHDSNDINLYNNNDKINDNANFNINAYPNNNKTSGKTKISKSSSMNFINDFQYSNNNNYTSNKKKTKIVLIKNINQENDNILNKSKLNKDKNNKGSDYNLKIDTNYLDLISNQSKSCKSNRTKDKALSKTISSEKIKIGNNIKIKIKELDNKISQWINKNIIKSNPKNLKINNNQLSHQYSTINVEGNNYNHNNYTSLRKFNKTNSMINISNDNNLKNEYLIKNKENQNFPSINSINSPNKKRTFELNTIDINTNSNYNNHQNKKRGFNTINNINLNLNKVQSLKNIHGPTINDKNPNFENIYANSPISFNFFNFNPKQKTRNKSKNRNFFNKNNINLNFGIGTKFKNKNFRINSKINNFNNNF